MMSRDQNLWSEFKGLTSRGQCQGAKVKGLRQIDNGKDTRVMITGTTDGIEKAARLKGSKIGSRFGSALLALGRLQGDRYDHFAVGAPLEKRRPF